MKPPNMYVCGWPQDKALLTRLNHRAVVDPMKLAYIVTHAPYSGGTYGDVECVLTLSEI